MFQVVCTAGKINVTMEFAKHKWAKSFAHGFRRGVKAWDLHHDFDLRSHSHRGFRFGQMLAYYCFRNHLPTNNLRVFVEVVGSDDIEAGEII